jgi:hypothetical protein
VLSRLHFRDLSINRALQPLAPDFGARKASIAHVGEEIPDVPPADEAGMIGAMPKPKVITAFQPIKRILNFIKARCWFVFS